MTTHYRVHDGLGRVTAFGCGSSGLGSSARTSDWRKVTCKGCKRTKEWKVAAQAPSAAKETK